MEKLEARQLLYGVAELGLPMAEGEPAVRPDFSLTDVNSASPTSQQAVSPREYLEQVSGWYFANGMCGSCSAQFGHLDTLQQELETTYPALRIQLLGVNALGQEAGNGPATQGRTLPWLQDVDTNQDGHSDAGSLWNVSYRDVYILDGANVQVAAFDVESKDLEQPANYAALRELLIDAAMTSQKPWQNADQPLDVNDDGNIEPLDALIIINKLNAEGPHELPPPQAGDPPRRYYDCNGNGEVAPVDALNVVNHLNGQNAGAGAEGEGPADLAPVRAAVGAGVSGTPLRVPAGQRWDWKTRPTLHAARPTLTATEADASCTHPLEQWFAERAGGEPAMDALDLDATME